MSALILSGHSTLQHLSVCGVPTQDSQFNHDPAEKAGRYGSLCNSPHEVFLFSRFSHLLWSFAMLAAIRPPFIARELVRR
jgi:hypothetical protein